MFIEIKGIKKHFGEGESRVDMLHGIDISLERGTFCILLGPSGCGKSTLLNIIGEIDSADASYIAIDGEKTAEMNERKLCRYRRKHLGYVFQQYNLISNLNIKENVETGAYLSDKPLPVDEVLQKLGLYEHRHKLPNQLSGGQQQRASIGRALVKNPDILLCDEPTGALDYKTSKEILNLIASVNQTYGTTVIMVTHNEVIQHMTDRIIKLRDGQVRKDLQNNNKVSVDALEW
ncbi:MAG: ABC transporter ATP-binding protein [Ruminococcus sp.]|nr:ABC transporter ATP-binding protein [Ruminococcus sp.]